MAEKLKEPRSASCVAYGPPKTIREVIGALEEIVGWSIQEQSPIGLFCALYLHVTRQVADGLRHGRLANPGLMEALDVNFAGRYLQAFASHRHGRPLTQAWSAAFAACDDKKIIALQHITIGMNAHINLDLAIAAADTAPGKALEHIKDDFMVISDMLAEASGRAQAALGAVSPRMRALDLLKGRAEVGIIAGIRATRAEAWDVAVKLASLSAAEREAEVSRLDAKVAKVAQTIARPSTWAVMLMQYIRRAEKLETSVAIRTLRDALEPAIEAASTANATSTLASRPFDAPRTFVEAGLRVTWPMYRDHPRLVKSAVVVGLLLAGLGTAWSMTSSTTQAHLMDWALLKFGGTPGELYPCFEVLERNIDVDISSSGSPRQSVASFVTRMKIRKIRDGQCLVANTSGTSSKRDPEFEVFPYNFTKQVVPTDAIMAGKLYRRWNILADISSVATNATTDVRFQSKMWDSFNNEVSEDATALCPYPCDSMKFTIRFGQATKNHRYYEISELDPAHPTQIQPSGVVFQPNNEVMEWVIDRPRLRYGYRVEWDW